MNENKEIKKIERISKIINILEEKLKQAGYFEIILKNGTYLTTFSRNVTIYTLSGQIFIKVEDDKGNPMTEIYIKPTSIRDILPKEAVLPKA